MSDRPRREPPASKALNVLQPSLFIEHEVDGAIVPQRPRDGYINATRLCQQAGKRLNDYMRLQQTQEYLDELMSVAGIPVTDLVEIRQGGDPIHQGTWVHPDVAINLGQWLSPKFAVQVSQWVRHWMMGHAGDHVPVHIRRYLKNRAKVPYTHFSMLNEAYLNFFAPLEDVGIFPTEGMMPDVSTGRMFSGFLRSMGIDPNEFPTYWHEFADDSRKRPRVEARLYPIEYLADFRKWYNEVWLPERAEKYLEDRLPQALPFLPQLKALPQA